MNISKGDIEFIENILMPKFRIKKLGIKYSSSKRKWPDIWISMNQVPIITVTQEWARQTMQERHKRLVHEALHIRGMEHDESIGYSTYPSRDSYSMRVYRRIIGTF